MNEKKKTSDVTVTGYRLIIKVIVFCPFRNVLKKLNFCNYDIIMITIIAILFFLLSSLPLR